MSYENFVRVKVVTPVTSGATSFAIETAIAPQKLPPTDGGYLVLCDSPGNPSWIEVIQYTSRSGLGISGVTRGVEGTTAVAWSGNVYAFQALMAGEANLIQTTLAGKQAQIAAGTTSQYWRGDKTWVDFFTDVRAATLTGLSTSTNAVITATDTVLSGLGKLQKQISDAATALAANVRAVVLTGYVSGAATALAATDSILTAFGKVQGQLDAKAPLASPALTGIPTMPTAAPGTNTTQGASTAFVEAARVILAAADALKAPLASPALTGIPTMPTAAGGTNTLQGASTAFVQQELATLIASAPGALNTLDELAAAMGDDANFAATMTTALAGKEPSIATGTTSQFWRGDKTWVDFATTVRASVLTGLSLATGTAITAADTVLSGLGKLQKQITDIIAAYAPLASPSLTGTPLAPTMSTGTTNTQIVNAAALAIKTGNIIGVPLNATGNTTLTTTQAGYRVLSLSGTLTGNVTLTMPASGNWIVINGTSGAFTVTLKHASGPVIVISTSYTGEVFADGGGTGMYTSFNEATGNFNVRGNLNTVGTIESQATINATSGCYNNGQKTWSRGDFDPTLKLTVSLNAVSGVYGAMYAPTYQALTAANQVYNSPIMIQEAALVATGGPAPGHIYNGPSITFLWNGYAARKLMMNNGGDFCYGDPNSTYCRMTVNGDIVGATWGGVALSTYLAANFITGNGGLGVNIAAMTAGVVGSYSLMLNKSGSGQSVNTTFAGASLAYTDSSDVDLGGPPGTWRCMSGVNAGKSVVMLRIA